MSNVGHIQSDEKALASVAAALSIVAGYIHLVVAPEHFKEWWGYGIFFLTVAIAQAVYGVALLLRPRRSLLAVGFIGNLLLIVLWVWTRTVGVPLIGPGAGEREAVASIDMVSKAVELALVLSLAALMRGQHPSAPERPGRPRVE